MPIGFTVDFLQNYNANYRFKIKHLNKTTANIYIYLPFVWNDLTYTCFGIYDSFIRDDEILTTEPVGDKDAEIYIHDSNLTNNKQIWTNNSNGINIIINNFVSDKMPIIIFGTDNQSAEPIFIMIFASRGSDTETQITGSKQLSGVAKTITRRGNTYHIDASIYSTYWITAPIGSNIDVENASL